MFEWSNYTDTTEGIHAAESSLVRECLRIIGEMKTPPHEFHFGVEWTEAFLVRWGDML